jgi:hypothetical protein
MAIGNVVKAMAGAKGFYPAVLFYKRLYFLNRFWVKNVIGTEG